MDKIKLILMEVYVLLRETFAFNLDNDLYQFHERLIKLVCKINGYNLANKIIEIYHELNAINSSVDYKIAMMASELLSNYQKEFLQLLTFYKTGKYDNKTKFEYQNFKEIKTHDAKSLNMDIYRLLAVCQILDGNFELASKMLENCMYYGDKTAYKYYYYVTEKTRCKNIEIWRKIENVKLEELEEKSAEHETLQLVKFLEKLTDGQKIFDDDFFSFIKNESISNNEKINAIIKQTWYVESLHSNKQKFGFNLREEK